MCRLGVLLAGLAVALLLAGEGLSGDKGTQPKGKAKLPQGWSKLGLSQEQLKTIQTIRTTYGTKITDLKERLDKLQKQEREEMFNVLTAGQKDDLRRIMLEKAGGGGSSKDQKIEAKDKKGS
jgi:hypothetical protein